MRNKINEELRSFLRDCGYGSQISVVEELVKKNIYKNVASFAVYFSQIIHGDRPISPKLMKGLESISIDSKRFVELVENSKKETPHPRSKPYSIEEEADKVYSIFRESISQGKDFYEKANMFIDFKNFTEKYTKNK